MLWTGVLDFCFHGVIVILCSICDEFDVWIVGILLICDFG